MDQPGRPTGEVFSRSETSHYTVSTTCREFARGQWIARATVSRRDTGEAVTGIQLGGPSQTSAMQAVQARVPALLASLDQTPHEWNRVALRQLLQDYRHFNDRLTSTLVRLQTALSAGTLDSRLMHEEFWKARCDAIEGAIGLTRAVMALKEQDRIDLMTSADSTYLSPDDPYHLGDLDARRALFQFVLDPTPAVIEAQRRHLDRWPQA